MNIVSRLAAGLALVLLASCAEPPRVKTRLDLAPVTYAMLEGWSDETFATVLPLMRNECQRIMRLPSDTRLGGAPGSIPNGSLAGEWSGACSALRRVPGTMEAARQYFEEWFSPYLVSDDGLISGYYEPQLDASAVQEGVFQTPLYAQPADLVKAKDTRGNWVTGRWDNGKFVPYFTRAEIVRGALQGRGLEIAWLRSSEDLFFLQLQGAGRLIMTNGSVKRVGFAAKNGAPYVPIGRILIAEGEMVASEVSMESVKNWLAAHPDRAQGLMDQNPNYVFFKRIDTIPLDRGAPGAMGMPLTPERSVAIDRAILPMGVPLWIEVNMPLANGHERRWSHLTFAQDVGSDIKGVGRADFFAGWGPEAERVAGRLRSHGRMVVLLPRPPA